MSSEAAQKAFPDGPECNEIMLRFTRASRAAFDLGAVEGLRQAAARCAEWHRHVGKHDHGVSAWLEQLADDWVVGQ